MSSRSDGATAILIPVLNRPHRVAPLLENIKATTPEPHEVVFIATRWDHGQVDALEQSGARYVLVAPEHEGYANKINVGAWTITTAGHVFTAADDLIFHDGWLGTALARMVDGIDVVGTNDLHNPRVLAGTHSTHSLVRRSYVEDPGAVIGHPGRLLCEEYEHAFCDDELVGTAQHRGVFAMAMDSHVEHMHPYFESAPLDDTYRKGMASIAHDEAVHDARKHKWGAVPSPPRRPARPWRR